LILYSSFFHHIGQIRLNLKTACFDQKGLKLVLQIMGRKESCFLAQT